MQATATHLVPFVPAGADFKTAIAFFLELGFVEDWRNDDLAELRFGGARFFLQNIDVPEWQKNQMLKLEVNDLEMYWSELAAKNLPARFATAAIGKPVDYPWGREIHIIDPAGVCWHIRQAAQARES